jgi:phosphoribosylglycinamide formyltransferase-1
LSEFAEPLNILVLVSGGGTNLQALIDAEKNNGFTLGNSDEGKVINAKIAAVLSDRAGVYALERAKAAGIPAFVEKPKRQLPKEERRKEFSDRILRLCREMRISLIVHAGFLSILAGEIIEEYSGRMINIHPCLLPKFGGQGMYGKHVHEAVLAAGETESGCTVHLVEAGIDTGAILLQRKVPVLAGDTPESLAERVLKEEHIALVQGVKLMIRRLTDEGGQKKPARERLVWHPAFFEAIQLELDEYSQELQFIAEYQLTTEPLRIDVVIIKKSKDIPIKKNIAAIFRKENILEYKSPDGYVSIEDFYWVYGYACLYFVLNELDIREMTLTFVESRYPRELLAHLQEVRGYKVEEKWPGVYYIEGDILPIQIINNRMLSAEENIWLKNLYNKLEVHEMRQVTDEIAKLGKAARIKAYLNVISKANKESLLEVLKMSDTTLTLDKIFEEVGLAAIWEARAEARGKAMGEENKAVEIAQNMLRHGLSIEETAEISGLDVSKVRALSDDL